MPLYASNKEIGSIRFLSRPTFGEGQKQDTRDKAIPLKSKQNYFSISLFLYFTHVDALYKTVTKGVEFITISFLD